MRIFQKLQLTTNNYSFNINLRLLSFKLIRAKETFFVTITTLCEGIKCRSIY